MKIYVVKNVYNVTPSSLSFFYSFSFGDKLTKATGKKNSSCFAIKK